MADALTANFEDTKPEVGASEETWGGKLNSNFDRYDDRDYRLLTTANYGEAGGTADALTVTLNPVWQSLAEGHRVWVRATADNTAGATLAVDSTGVKDIKNMDGSTLTPGQLKTGRIYGLVYDGTEFRLIDAPRATRAQIIAGTDAYAAATADSLGGGHSIAATGSYTFPGGLIHKWGTSSDTQTDDGAMPAITFAAAFPNACFNVQITGLNASSAHASDAQVKVISKSASGFTPYGNASATTGQVTGYMWFAIGN